MESFDVQIVDPNSDMDTITVNVTLDAVADPPVITQGDGPLAVTMDEDGTPTAFVAPTLGATDVDGDTLTWSISSAASHGTATVSGTGASPGTFTYVPDANYNGSDAFTIQVSDGNMGTDSIVVNVTIDSIDDYAPQFVLDYAYVGQWGSNGAGDGQFSDPQCVAFDSAGNVYVSEWAGHRVQKFDADGNYLLQWGGNGSGNGQFNNAAGIGVDSSDNIYVVDSSNQRIQKFNTSGTYLAQWGSGGSADGQFNFPVGLTIDPSDNIYVSGVNNDRVQKFDTDGTFLLKWGSGGSGDGQFDTPFILAAGPSGTIYVADQSLDCIQRFDSDGTFLLKWGGTGWHGLHYRPE